MRPRLFFDLSSSTNPHPKSVLSYLMLKISPSLIDVSGAALIAGLVRRLLHIARRSISILPWLKPDRYFPAFWCFPPYDSCDKLCDRKRPPKIGCQKIEIKPLKVNERLARIRGCESLTSAFRGVFYQFLANLLASYSWCWLTIASPMSGWGVLLFSMSRSGAI